MSEARLNQAGPYPLGEAWEWPQDVWRRIVERARAGRSLAPKTWPDGARCAVALSFNADHETFALPDADENLSRISQGQYGSRQGIPRLRRLLLREQIGASFFYPAVAALLHPDEVRGVAADGHEIGIQSWIGERNAGLTFLAERDLTMRAADVLDRLGGRPPVGIRCAFRDFSANTMMIIQEMGLLYDSSLMADDEPYELVADGNTTGIVELPSEWIRDDSSYFTKERFVGLRPYAAPSAVEEVLRGEFDGAWHEHGLFQLTLHPHLIGHRSRIVILERLIRYMKSRGSVWFATHEAVARWCKANA
jgi:peptidoglycan/xylan/chitin deacetylase (PgdA/CDA1 family)